MSVRLDGIRPVHVQAGLRSDDEVIHHFGIEVQKFPEVGSVVLYAELVIQRDHERAQVASTSYVRKSDAQTLLESSDDEILSAVEDAGFEHLIYDSAATVVRQIAALTGLELSIPLDTIAPQFTIEDYEISEVEPGGEAAEA